MPTATAASADAFFRKLPRWQEEFVALRAIFKTFPLEEGFKWRWPCYMLEGRNVALIHGFKEHCDVLFFKGSLLTDPDHVLEKPSDGTRAMRQMRFHSLAEVRGRTSALKAAIEEAIALERSGVKPVKVARPTPTPPAELAQALRADATLRKAFAALTPGRQRSWILHIGGAKQSATRTARIDRARPQILDGKGFQER